jgi:uncharacterized protein (TIGR02145 family)
MKKILGLTIPMMALSLAFCFTACGDDSSSGSQVESAEELDEKDSTNQDAKSSSSKKDSKESSSSIDAKDSTGKNVIQSKSISGVSQKGPFVKGSTVNVYELDSNLAQTGKSFTGKINSDDGKFSVESVTLANKYALLEANGYFRNEITGEKSKGTITLYALTDLSEREKVNVNLLTHLEYERTLYLVNEKGKSVSEAKKQAESEVLKAFGIEGKFGNSEDLDIFGSGDGNAALLAVSILLLRDLSEADLTEELTKFAVDIEKDGIWDDDGEIAVIGKWASEMDLSGKLGGVYSNVSQWNLGTYPSAFEKYVRNFWYAYFDLDECDKDSEGKVMGSEKSQYSASDRFICKNGAWVYASDLEKDTYQWKPGEDGEIRAGDVVAVNHYMYYASYKRWDYMLSFDIPKDYHFNAKVTYGEMTDPRDKKKYKTVAIGEGAKAQTWMAENLNYESEKGSMCYDGLSKNCDVTGRLYTWYAAVDKQVWEVKDSMKSDEIVQGVCPQGWHLPTQTELDVLVENVGGDLASAGKKLKAKTGWKDAYDFGIGSDAYAEYDSTKWKSGAGTDDFGFSAISSGHAVKGRVYGENGETISRTDDYESLSSAGEDAYFWSSSDKGAYYKLENVSDWFSYSDCETPYNHCEDMLNYEMASVRCVKDASSKE